ncbi:MAG: type 4a pilus biogenesis protein PilO [Rhizobacter sp.]|nr:type 4a pilus biogenesis protein PilO [Bacteriovorax sp.]
MAKLFKNLHWIIIAFALFNFWQAYDKADTELKTVDSGVEEQKKLLTKNKKTQREIANYYKNIKEEKEKIERVAKEIEKMQQLLPSEISDSDNINLLRKMADDVNIKELSIAPDLDSVRGFYIARRYKLKAKATFLQFLIMFEKIGENKRILNIGESLFQKSDAPQRGKFQVIEGEFMLEAYRFNPNYKEDRGIDEIQKKFDDDAKTAPKKSSRPRKAAAKEKDGV